MKIITTTELRATLAKTLRRVRLKKEPIAVIQYAGLIGFLVPSNMGETLAIGQTKSVGSTELRSQMTELLESFYDGVDAIEIYSHDRKVALLVSARYVDRFPAVNLPIVLD
jgi:antitoxin (DNA-binding transcriptional repressor) of toxin-antitoxin stability system